MSKKKHDLAKPGVYIINNEVNGKRYIGSSKNAWARFRNHLSCLKINDHDNVFIKQDYDIYGIEVFGFNVLEFCEIEKLREREQYWIDTLNPEYNINRNSASCKGVKRRPETIAKFIGREMSTETRKKLSEAKKGKPGVRKGMKASKATIEKLRIANLGKKYPNEINIKKGRKGELHSWWGRGKSVVQLDLEGNNINSFPTASQAARFLGKENGGGNILKCCDKKIPTSYGFKWEYKVQD